MYISIYNYMNQYRTALIKSIANKEKKIGKLPEGSLRCNKCRNFYTWYRMIKNKDQNERKIIHKKQRKLAEDLAYKAYLSHALNVEKRQLRAIQLFCKYYPNDIPGTSYIEACPEHKALLKNRFSQFSYSAESLEWMLEHPPVQPPYLEKRTVPTVLGYNVRSKSESEIVSKLVQRGIQFRYEWPLYIEELGEYRFPDFTIIDPISNETIYLEHFGLMDSESYTNENAEKLYHYFKQGILPEKNLFCSYESAESKFTSLDADALIDRIFMIT